MEEHSLLADILLDAKIGWWRVDLSRRVFILSDYLKKLIGSQDDELGFDAFLARVDERYRSLIQNQVHNGFGFPTQEQVLSLTCPQGEVWLRWKVLHRESSDDGELLRLTGYVQKVDDEALQKADNFSYIRMNSLAYQLNSISHTLLSLLHAESTDCIINKVLADILKMFNGSRAYIGEFDWERQMHQCTYEVTANGITQECDTMNRISMAEVPWWMQQLGEGIPIILTTLDELPAEARREKVILSQQDIKSMIVMPLVSHEKIWGYVGIDIVERHRTWSNEDCQWFASLANIINICIELQRSRKEAQTERDYLQNLYRYMPLGYIRFKILYEDAGNPIDYQILDANYAAEAILQLPRERYVGKKGSELGWDVADTLPLLARTLASDHYIEQDNRLTISGKFIHSILYSTREDEVISLLSDISDVQQTHYALDRSEKLLRNIYDNIPVGLELYDKTGRMVDINNKDMEIFGVRQKEDVIGLNFFDNPNIPAEIRKRVSDHEEFAFKIFYPFDHLQGYYNSSKTGFLEIYTTVSILYDAQGEMSNFMLINIDNTEINRAHSRIAEFESSFSLVSRYGKVGYCRFDLLSKAGFGMPQWFLNLGEKPDTPLEEIIGIYRYVEPEDRDSIMASIKRVLAGETYDFSKDLRIHTSEGLKWTRVNVMRNPMNNDPSKIEMVCVNYDITQLKETEMRLIEAKNKAEVSDRLKSAFLANMSHEIRTPLNAIVGFSNLLIESDDADDRCEYMAIVQENSELLLKLISDILDLSKIEAGTFEFNFTTVDVNQMCQDIIRTLEIKAQERNNALLFGTHQSECYLITDKSRLTQVLTNFINNALKFTTQGTVTLGYEFNREDEITFYVEDTGTGIPQKDLPSIFDRFVKLNTFMQGTGLGLSISKSIVEQLNGRIGVDSEEGRGSRFWFTIPFSQFQQAEPLPESVQPILPEMTPCDKAPVLLIAEDTDSNFLLLSLLLKKEYEIRRAKNGLEAVQLFRELAPDLILMDIKMPEMDGLEATEMIRRENQTIPIIAITAFAFDKDRQRALSVGCNDYLSKPISADILKRKLRKFLNY